MKEKKGIITEIQSASAEITEFSKKFQDFEKKVNEYVGSKIESESNKYNKISLIS
jgi:hypothetical protein